MGMEQLGKVLKVCVCVYVYVCVYYIRGEGVKTRCTWAMTDKHLILNLNFIHTHTHTHTQARYFGADAEIPLANVTG